MSKNLTYKDYRTLFRVGKRKHSKHYIFFWMPFRETIYKVGIVKSYGKAFERNKEKRRMRAFFREVALDKPYLVLSVCKSVSDMRYDKKKNFFWTLYIKILFKIKIIVIGTIRLYQYIFRFKVPTCRFEPTCSFYMIEAIEEWGVFRGILLGLWRILRCHPFAKQRVDMVPLKKDRK